jgi:hypothetical protein
MSRKLSSNQKTLNKVVRHARRQGCKSVDPLTGSCLYRGPAGRRCFAGAVIPNRAYRKEFEGKSACSIVVAPTLQELGLNVNLCQDLQDIHDEENVDRWEEKFEDVAGKYGLTVPPLP